MTKQEQDKLWNDLSEEQKKEYRKEFKEESEFYHRNVKHCDRENEFEYNTGCSDGVMSTLEELFGKHNLQSEPKIKTWEDIQNMKEDSNFFMRIDDNLELSDKVYSKCIATLKITKLIELGYGGVITDEEWRIPTEKFVIKPHYHRCKYILEKSTSLYYKWFIAFHTEEQMEEFMSYPENVKLVEQYYMI